VEEFESSRRYAAMVDAAAAQTTNFGRGGGDAWAERASHFRLDPRREVDVNTAAVLSLIEPGDTVLDVGGGAGRVALPAALRCRSVLNVDPSAAMRAEFEASAREAGITNATAIAGNWPEGADGLAADVVTVSNVTYFVRDIVPFVRALDAVARRRVIITVWSVAPASQGAELFELLHGKPRAMAPSYRELLPVLWDLGLMPDVRVLPGPLRRAGERPPTREAAIQLALQRGGADQLEGAAATVEAHFDQLFESSAEGFLPRWIPPVRELLVTWTRP
jgi:SAM-dependent methyltransferase